MLDRPAEVGTGVGMALQGSLVFWRRGRGGARSRSSGTEKHAGFRVSI